MKLTEQKSGAKFLKMLQCGVSGTGKTCMASTFPRPIYYFDVEDGIKSLFTYYDNDITKLEGIEYDSYLDPNPKSPSAFTRMEQKLTEFHNMGTKLPFQTIVVDSLTALEARTTNYVIASSNTKRMLGAANLQDYGLIIWQLEQFIQRLLPLPCHIIVNCHVKIIQHELTKEIFTQPLVVGKALPNKLPGWFDESFYLSVKSDGKRYWQIRPDGLINAAKTRTLPKTTPTYVEADFSQLAKYLSVA